jgi:predicted metal-dependent hydrolase
MVDRINLGNIVVEVIKKDIKNLHLSVFPPAGKVRISAPLRMDIETIRVFAITKLTWIKNQQKKLRNQERESPREYLNRESHYVWGKRYLLKVEEKESAPEVELKHSRMILRVRPGADQDKKREILDAWYREQVKEAVPELILNWAKLMKVNLSGFHVQKMKTKWGSCSSHRNSIRLNTDLAKKPPECLEYIVVHELAHLIEPTHNDRFIRLMNQFMPKWKFYKDQLNRLPVKHEEWGY